MTLRPDHAGSSSWPRSTRLSWRVSSRLATKNRPWPN